MRKKELIGDILISIAMLILGILIGMAFNIEFVKKTYYLNQEDRIITQEKLLENYVTGEEGCKRSPSSCLIIKK